MRSINAAGLDLVKRFEGLEDGDPATVNLDPYLDPVGIWTIGWGHPIRDNAGVYLRGASNAARVEALYPDGIARWQADDLVRADLLDAARDVLALVKVPIADNQFAALTSFEFNCGGLFGSTLLRKLNAGDVAGAAEEFGRWTKATNPDGVVVTLPGLVTRRAAERALFLQP